MKNPAKLGISYSYGEHDYIYYSFEKYCHCCVLREFIGNVIGLLNMNRPQTAFSPGENIVR